MKRLHRETFGAQLRQLHLDRLLLSETRLRPHTELPLHEHSDAYFCLVVGGGFAETMRSRAAECSPGSLMVHPAGDAHANRISAVGAHCLNIHPDPSWLAESPLRRMAGDLRHIALPARLPSLLRLRRELLASDQAAPLALESAVLELLADAWRQPPRTDAPPWLDRVIQCIEDQPTQAASLAALAAEADVHPAHLARVFRRIKGLSIGDYVRARRIETARLALHGGERSIAEIASAAGFTDQSHFSRLFKQLVGETPRRYRQAMQSASYCANPVQDRPARRQ